MRTMAKGEKQGISKETIAAAGAATAAAVVAAVGAYWFYGTKNAAKHRRVARSWMLKARADVLDAVEGVIEKAGEIDKTTYMSIVDKVLRYYEKGTGVTVNDVTQMARDLKGAWTEVQKASKQPPKRRSKKRTTKKTAKKTASTEE